MSKFDEVRVKLVQLHEILVDGNMTFKRSGVAYSLIGFMK
jgi:hypothetical protein